MKKSLTLILLSLSAFSYAGKDFNSYCNDLKGTEKKGKIVSFHVVSNHYNNGTAEGGNPAFIANTKIKLSDGNEYHYGIMRNANALYDIAKVSYLTQADINLCVGNENNFPGGDAIYMIGLDKEQSL
ncbi:hypothetical protein F9883_03625 [Morganella morganii]|uniref:hypothetical protein n=1 Tax=Morganella morganii TaxID=582 RepID=UPI0015F40310|nr:hypothetical protein [Morganella morganii]MBA5806974.1 hypothetical protein [Morganella morganii]